jgi:riboflavin synthase alpha subunit
MFTGIIEKLGKVAKVERNGGNLELYVNSDLES